jgi:RimJ/RimL family protein N-acetyltransferase
VNTAGLSLPNDLVTLRDFTVEDVKAAYAVVGDERVSRWLSFDTRDHAGAVAMVEGALRAAQATPRTEFYIAIEPADRPTLIGFVRLALGTHHGAKLGYAIHADHWGHGYATEAALTILRFGFTELDLHRVTAAVGPDNAASVAVLEHLGFTLEGKLRDHVFTNEAWRDRLLYSLLRHEFTPTASAHPTKSGKPQPLT